MSTERVVLRLHTHQALETKCIQRGSPYRTVVAIGGIRSGKTLVIARWMIDRSQWDTAQYHALFANTGVQLHGAVLDEVRPWLTLAGIETSWNRQPPPHWLERWRRNGVAVPARRHKYTNILILSTGLHIYCGSMTNKSYQQVKGMKFGSIVIEEVAAGASEQGVRYLFERVNCGLGPVRCAELHHHVKVMHSNPPDDDGHWIWDWLARRERSAATAAGLESADHDSYPCLERGIGDTIYIKSRTIDNIENLPAEFIDDMESNLDAEEAERVLGGVMSRRRTGRAMNAFTRQNVYPVSYDADRSLYLAFDFNTNPTVCVLAHPLRRGEYPSESAPETAQVEGVFGEFFHLGGMDAHQLAMALAQGERSSHGYLPIEWQGVATHRGPVVLFGDATGDAKKSITGLTAWSIVKDVMRQVAPERLQVRVPSVNQLKQIQIRSTNARLCNARGDRQLFIDPHCDELIHDLESVPLAPDGTIVKPGGPRPGSKYWHRTHLLDGLMAMCCELHPMGRDIDPAANLPKVLRKKTPPIPSHL